MYRNLLGDNYKYINTRKAEVIHTKHVVRYTFRTLGLTLKEIAEAEGRITGTVPHHTTIMNSINRIKEKV